MYGGNGSGQTIDDGLHGQQPASIHLLVRKNTRHTTKRQRGHTQRTSKSYSSQSWLNDCLTRTFLQQQQIKEALSDYILGQIRVVKAQFESNCSMTMSTKHCLLPWMVRHAAWTVNRCVIHSDGYSSVACRWGSNYERAI